MLDMNTAKNTKNSGKMRNLLIACLMLVVCTASFAQDKKDWAKFYRYEEANKTVVKKPRAVFMGDSITDSWAKKRHRIIKNQQFYQ